MIWRHDYEIKSKLGRRELSFVLQARFLEGLDFVFGIFYLKTELTSVLSLPSLLHFTDTKLKIFSSGLGVWCA